MARSFPRRFRFAGRPARLLNARAAIAALLGMQGFSPAAFNRFDPLDTAAVPRFLSQTGVYSDMAAKTPDTSLKYFEVNAPLWSDGARKQRWVVPPPGKPVPYVDSTDLFDYPESTVFVKTFLLDSVEGDPSSSVYWETRLLVKGVSADWGTPRWHGFSYKWNAGATEAVLVDREGYDTVFYHRRSGGGGPQTYKKWRFPSRNECDLCHREAFDEDPLLRARSVLGFMPVQLKRPDPSQPGLNQIDRLFDQGVFSGIRPAPEQLAKRWKGIHEPVPTGLSADQRFRILDTMARSYIAANCSGCHGERGMRHLNYDFFALRPAMEFGTHESLFHSLFPWEQDDSLHFPEEWHKYRFALHHAGMDTSAGAVWNMALPGDGIPRLIRSGYVAASSILYRQWSRNTPAADSAAAYREETARDPAERRLWLFDQPWGSKAWRDQLAQHGLTPASVMMFEPDRNQMPPLASHLPDTAAMRVLGEWAKTYRTLYRVPGEDSVTRIRGKNAAPRVGAIVQGRILIVPADWEGRPARMISVSGRVHPLYAAGRNRYVIPESAAAGVYFFRIGERRFTATVLR